MDTRRGGRAGGGVRGAVPGRLRVERRNAASQTAASEQSGAAVLAVYWSGLAPGRPARGQWQHATSQLPAKLAAVAY